MHLHQIDADIDLLTARAAKDVVLAQLGAEYQQIEQNLFAQVNADSGWMMDKADLFKGINIALDAVYGMGCKFTGCEEP